MGKVTLKFDDDGCQFYGIFLLLIFVLIDDDPYLISLKYCRCYQENKFYIYHLMIIAVEISIIEIRISLKSLFNTN